MLTTFTNADLFTIVYLVTLAALAKIIIIYVNHKRYKNVVWSKRVVFTAMNTIMT